VMLRIGSVSLLAVPIGLIQAWMLNDMLKNALAWGTIVGGASFLTVAGCRFAYPVLVSGPDVSGPIRARFSRSLHRCVRLWRKAA
jgi:hypothetical protein